MILHTKHCVFISGLLAGALNIFPTAWSIHPLRVSFTRDATSNFPTIRSPDDEAKSSIFRWAVGRAGKQLSPDITTCEKLKSYICIVFMK